ncbi:hypothetical protein [Corynebacterium pygosceleis]|uniref:Uncharacterized protein n=1 Tax=Corynebacterium pygosceleis TaxID=2800406 RepID=A0A9Q4C9F4_9CORY|nr:hypothetical protein [Corynebacterium pygosceleis]MCK7638478.1 hypothetical protein [Corynebacterium pygosceleis]MCK7675458.1 hypothetical protein [Corynebacterium pygosceleis]MCL0121148.1 hypothetical protein [Corynebacterium pygosceleis]MCX7469142.1 hypothetical protein [Corynebacterium pygosceleis]
MNQSIHAMSLLRDAGGLGLSGLVLMLLFIAMPVTALRMELRRDSDPLRLILVFSLVTLLPGIGFLIWYVVHRREQLRDLRDAALTEDDGTTTG